ncbi:MAG: hypothetical protein AABX72_03775 [Nanoarchaeota archaeon]
MATTTIVEQKEFPLLKRKNYTLRMEYPKKPTPSTNEIRKDVAAFLKGEENRVAIKFVKQEFGSNSALVTAYLYHDEKAMKDMEEIKKRKKKEGAEQSGQESQAKK